MATPDKFPTGYKKSSGMERKDNRSFGAKAAVCRILRRYASENWINAPVLGQTPWFHTFDKA
jgi:hypothetical protein